MLQQEAAIERFVLTPAARVDVELPHARLSRRPRSSASSTASRTLENASTAACK
jgi:hypothetical protein